MFSLTCATTVDVIRPVRAAFTSGSDVNDTALKPVALVTAVVDDGSGDLEVSDCKCKHIGVQRSHVVRVYCYM